MTAAFDTYLDTGGSDGSPGTEAAFTNLRFRTDDANTQDTTNPIPIISGQTKLSYWRQVYLFCTTAPTTKVDNLKFYTDGTGFGTGITCYIGDEFPTKNSTQDTGYEVATGTPGDTGDEMVAGHAGLTGKTDAFTYTSGSMLSGPSISEGTSQIDAQSEMSNYIILQVQVVDTASPGTKSTETMTFQYDET